MIRKVKQFQNDALINSEEYRNFVQKTQSEILQGISTVVVLRVINNHTQDGIYRSLLLGELEESTKKNFIIEEEKLYPLLNNLEKDGVIRSEQKDVSGQSRKCFFITSEGQKIQNHLMGIFSKLIESLSDLMEINVVLPEKNVIFCPNCANKIDLINSNTHFCEVCGLNIQNLRVVPKIKNDIGDEISKLNTKKDLKFLKHPKLPPSEQEVIDNFDIKMVRGDIDTNNESNKKVLASLYDYKTRNVLDEAWSREIFGRLFYSTSGKVIHEGQYLVHNNHIIAIKWGIKELPENIGNLSELLFLDIGGPKIEKIPQSIGNLSELLFLEIGGTKIEKIPKSIGKLKNLRCMRLYYNINLISLPESIGGLSNLIELDLDYNNLTTLPESIGNLSKLKEIVLDHNQITILPESFKKLNIYDIRTLGTPLRSLSNINFTTISDYFITIENLIPKGKNLLKYWDDKHNIFDSEDMDDHERIIRDFVPVSAYYSKSPLQLANQFCGAPDSLTNEEIERLVWEASPKERELLEANFPEDNEIIQKINDRLSISLNSGSKIRI